MNIKFILKWIKWRYFEPAIHLKSINVRRMWWAHNDDDSFVNAYICHLTYPHLYKSFFAKLIEERTNNVLNLTKLMGQEGVDWKYVRFGHPMYIAILTKNDDWVMYAKLQGTDHTLLMKLVENSDKRT